MNLTNHHCHARECNRCCRPEFLMCGEHWAKVPDAIKRAVIRHYRPGQCADKRPSPAWLAAAAAAIGAVALLEGREVGARQAIAAFDHGFRHECLSNAKVEAARKTLSRKTGGEQLALQQVAPATSPADKRPPEPCWYCGQASALVCEAQIGLRLLNVPPPLHRHFIDVSLMPGARNSLTRMAGMASSLGGTVEALPCGAAACRACARRNGWRRQGVAPTCTPEIQQGKPADLCHVHAVSPPETISPVAEETFLQMKDAIRKRFGTAQNDIDALQQS